MMLMVSPNLANLFSWYYPLRTISDFLARSIVLLWVHLSEIDDES